MTIEIPRDDTGGKVGPVTASVVPRFAGPATFARLPRLDEVGSADIVVVGVPFDAGVSYRSGARFGPGHIRGASKLLRPYNPAQDALPFALAQVADAGDIAANPFNIEEAVNQIHDGNPPRLKDPEDEEDEEAHIEGPASPLAGAPAEPLIAVSSAPNPENQE